MGWFKDGWRFFWNLDEPKTEPAEPTLHTEDRPVHVEHQHVIFDPLDATEVAILVRAKFCDGRETERRDRMRRDQFEELAQDLIADFDVKEAWIFEELSYHRKSYPDPNGDADDPMSTVIIATASGMHSV